MLLANGQLPFLGTVKQSILFFESIGRPVPLYYNPADHFLEVLDEAKRVDDAQIGLKDIPQENGRAKKNRISFQKIKALIG